MLPRKRKRIALFSAYLAGQDYNDPLWKSIYEECKRLDLDLVIYSNRYIINNHNQKKIFRKLFKLINTEQFDGVIIATASLINYIPKDLLLEMTKHINIIPKVHISYTVDSDYSVHFDTSQGMKLLVDHLHSKHRFKNYGYISGPISHPECQLRLTSFRENLKKHHIKLKEEHIFYVDFSTLDMEERVMDVLDGRLKLDTLVCLNDTFASKIIELLNKHNYRVPEDIAVTGFDNTVHGLSQIPEITTVDQSIENMGKESVKLLNNTLNSIKCKKEINLIPELIIRDSCGCNCNKSIDDNINISDQIKEDPIKYLNTYLQVEKDHNKIKELNNRISGYIYSQIGKKTPREKVLELCKLEKDVTQMVSNHRLKSLQKELMGINMAKFNTRNQFERIISTNSFTELFIELSSLFKNLEIKTYYLLLYDLNGDSSKMQLKHGCIDGDVQEFYKRSLPIEIENFIPEEYMSQNEQHTLLSLPIFSNDVYYGYLIIEHLESHTSTFYEELQMNISSVLMNIISKKELERHQNLLIENEKLAYKGQLVSGLSHVLNTPLGIVLTASSHLIDLLSEMTLSKESKNLTRKEMLKYIQNCYVAIDLVEKNIHQTIDLIDRFKQVSEKRHGERLEIFNISKLLNRCIKEYSDNNLNFNIDCSEKITLRSYPTLFQLIIKTLITNSIQFGLSKDKNIDIYIKITVSDSNIVFIYWDNGEGCSKEHINRIFEPFYTTSRGTGSLGLGLTILHNYITNTLKGNINTDLVDNMLTFTITAPILL